MSRAKKGAAPESKVPNQPEEAAVIPLYLMILRAMFENLFVEKIPGLKQEVKKMNDHLQALEEKQQQRSPAGKADFQEEKSGKRAVCATEAAG